MLTVALSVLVGLAGAVAVASPAFAHHTNITGEPWCDTTTGEWVVDWTVTSSNNAEEYWLTSVSAGPDGSSLTGLPVGKEHKRSISKEFTGEQILPPGAQSASLTVSAEWNNSKTDTDRGKEITVPDEPCAPESTPAPVAVNSTSACEGMAVEVANPEDGEPAEFLLTPTEGDKVAGSLTPGESATHEFEAGDDGLTVTVAIGDEATELVWEEPADCEKPEGGEGGGDEELPVTGFGTTAAVTGAALLLALGTGLFLLARRRRITFTA